MSINKPKVYYSIKEWMDFRKSFFKEESLGFVPTMGALHEGHLSLIKKSLSENDKTVVSIYVNPTQFNDKKDLEKYPIDLDKDLEQLSELGVEYAICPKYEGIYKDNYRFNISENEFSKKLCGKERPGHFDGVLTVVMKLFNIVRPNKAYFGEKDYQQLTLIKDMVDTFFMDIKIVSCKTIRENDGLAMSSRNKLLSVTERIIASEFNQILKMKIPKSHVIKKLEDAGFKVDYVEEINCRRLAAVRVGNVRLIDNYEF